LYLVVSIKAGESINGNRDIQRSLTIKVWGIISINGLGPLVRYNDTMTAIKYRDLLGKEVLRAYPNIKAPSWPFDLNNDWYKLGQDNSSSHRASIVSEWLAENYILLFKLPPKSPDFDSIENVGAYLRDRLYHRIDKLKSCDDVWTEALNIWNSIKTEYTESLYESLQSRAQMMFQKRGGPI
jgi:DDE superfamily endonuclease